MAQGLIEQAFDWIADLYKDRKYAVVSGLTDIGISALAYREASKRGWKTVGVACSKAEQYGCYACDEKHIVGDNWGDESATFLGMLDAFVRVGGGKQSFTETKAAKDKNLTVVEYDLEALLK